MHVRVEKYSVFTQNFPRVFGQRTREKIQHAWLLYPVNRDEANMKIKTTAPKRVRHPSIVIALVISSLSFVATPASATPTNPGYPTNVIATRTSATTADVSFTAPANNGGTPIISYTATSAAGGLAATITQAGSGVIAITGLTPGVSYNFFVFATNSVGNSVGNQYEGYSNATRLGNLYNGSGSGDVACGTSGYFIVLDNGVAGNWNCTGSVNIPSGVTSIGTAFDADPGYNGFGYYNSYGSTIATRVDTLTISNTVASIANFAFRSPNITSLIIPDNVTTIGIYAFAGATRLETLTLGNGLTSVSAASFAGASVLTSLTLGNSITSIGGEAFGWAPSLTSLTIPNSVTSIEAHAFREATGLTTLNLGSGLTSIGDYAFDLAVSLSTVTIPDSVESIGLQAFRSVASPFTLNYCGNAGLADTGLPNPATNAATCTPAPPRNLVATAGSESATIAFTAGASFGESITNYEYSLNGATYVALSPADTTTPVAISGLTNGTTYLIRLRAVSSRGSGAPSTIVSVTPLAAALTPTFATPTSTADGFTVQITNHNALYTWAGTATSSGSVSISGSGLVTVTGVEVLTASTATITTTRTGFIGGTAAVTATSLVGAALTPTFGSPTVTADGFSVQISNYNNAFTWSGSATASGSVAINGSGLVTVTGVAAGTSSTATITTTRTDYTGGSATVSGTSMSNVATLSALTLSSGTLSPSFSSSTDSYTASVSSSTTSITVTPTRTQANATITVNGTTVASGVASGSIALNEGSNTITVIGTAQDGITNQTYTITVTRAAQPTITIGTTDFEPRATTNVGVTLSGFDTSLSYQVTVKFVNVATNADVSNGTLSATKGGTSTIPGYSSYAATKLGFMGTYSQVASTLASLTWNPETGTGNITMRIGISAMPGVNEFYDANSGHYYRFVSAGLNWTSARTAAEETIVYGMRGYLAEINSAAENNFIGIETTATDVWIGATDAKVEGSWIWDGAASLNNKPSGSGDNAGRSASFHSWADREPNNDKGLEDCAVTNWRNNRGKWNDLPCFVVARYLIEFGGRPGETSTAIGATLTRTVNAVPPVQYTITYYPMGGDTTPTSPSRIAGSRFTSAGAISRAPSGGITYQFVGWDSGNKIYGAGETITVGYVPLELEAVWALQLQVTYLNNGGTFIGDDIYRDAECLQSDNKCLDGQTIKLNSAPTRVGYTFVGWKNHLGIQVVDSDDAVAGIQTAVTSTNYIFSASWLPITYTITYTSSGSSVPTQSALEEGQAFIVGSPGTRAGFEFSGWSDGDSIYFPDSEIIVGTSNIALTAQWTAVFTVTYSPGLGSGTPSSDPASYPGGYALFVATDTGISRSGFTFSGWSDGTTIYQTDAVYTIGSSNVTLTAQWTAVAVAPAPAPTPTPSPTPTPTSEVSESVQTAAALALKVARDELQIDVAKNQKTYLEIFVSSTSANSSDASLIPHQKSGATLNPKTEEINSSQSANLKISAKKISLSSKALQELKDRVSIRVTTTGISVTPVSGFTGSVIVPIAGMVDGVETVVLNKVVINPVPPKAEKFAPTSINQSSINWTPSTSQITGYLVTLNGKEICQTTTTTCPVAALIGPKSVVAITALGNDQTVSAPVLIPYVATRPIPALKVNFAVGSSILSVAQKNEIRSVARVIDTQGFTRLVVSGFTDSSGSLSLNKKLSEDRAKSVAAFVRTLLPKIAIKASAFGPKKPLASNASLSGKAQNRRTEIATW
jgi:uncharacterized repeat protein (TIGR02543 family)